MTMASLNKVLLIGNLTHDPELRRIPSGTAVVTLRMAVNEVFNTRSGERTERTVYVDVEVWDRIAENCEKYLSRGSPVFVEGRLQLDSWEDRETGQKRSKLKVRADRVDFLSTRGGGGGGGRGSSGGDVADTPPRPSSKPAPAPADSYQEPLGQTADDEEIPF